VYYFQFQYQLQHLIDIYLFLYVIHIYIHIHIYLSTYTHTHTRTHTHTQGEAIFGDRGRGGPVKRERALEPAIYAASALAGLFCCSFMHFVTVPVDVVKTRMQVRERESE
jgi:hypothetical protein